MMPAITRVATTGLLILAAGCSARQQPPTPVPVPTPVATQFVMPTVPPGTPLPPGGTPLPTRPLKNPEAEKAKQAGKSIGGVVTFAGIARADGKPVKPESVNADGVPVFIHYVGSGFLLVVEGKPGISNLELGRRIFAYDPEDPSQRPDVEIQANQPLGNGSTAVCDQRRPNIGGIPAIDPPSFAETKEIAATLNDFSCRLQTFIQSSESCTLDEYGDFSFLKPDSTNQFCMVIARAWNFPQGDTLVSVRLRDNEGNPGPVSRFILRRTVRPTPTPAPYVAPTPTISRRRP